LQEEALKDCVVRIACLYALVPDLLLAGCNVDPGPVIDAGGPVGLAERDLLFTAVGLMMIVVIPVFVLTFWFVWCYRARKGASYMPNWSYSGRIDAVIWLVPSLIVVVIASLVWIYSYKLDPYRPLAAKAPTVEVQAVAEDWKWLFIYPTQNIASVNELVFPAGRPVNIVMTSDTAMNALYIPGLGGQIYAMAGMRSKLNVLADKPRTFTGRNTQYTGHGFADQSFKVKAMSESDFAAWVRQVRQSSKTLDPSIYNVLTKPSTDVPVTYYSSVVPHLFEHIIAKYNTTPEPTVRSAASSNKDHG
jgi:cytochrome o ubiquinol oxidase subunit 2